MKIKRSFKVFKDKWEGKTIGELKILSVNVYATVINNKLTINCKCLRCGKTVVKTAHLLFDSIYQNEKRGYNCPITCGCARLSVNGDNAKGKRHRLYSIWNNIIGRCECEKTPAYKHYGGRGIKICDEWRHDYLTFKKWAIDNGYKEGLTIDRIDVNGNYEPSNCRWVTQGDQQNNKRNNVKITIDGITKTATQWANTSGIPQAIILRRIRDNWEPKRAVFEPIHSKCRHYDMFRVSLRQLAPIITSRYIGMDAAYIFVIWKYLWRYQYKNGKTDLAKAQDYIRMMIEDKCEVLE